MKKSPLLFYPKLVILKVAVTPGLKSNQKVKAISFFRLAYLTFSSPEIFHVVDKSIVQTAFSQSTMGDSQVGTGFQVKSCDFGEQEPRCHTARR